MRCATLLLACLACPAWAADGHYDLGGPCQDVRGPGQFSEIRQARNSGDWSRVIELEKASVRAMCGNAYRWFELADALLDAHRPAEALAVLQEMDSRGFDVNPALIGGMHPGVEAFVKTPAFRTSPLGLKIGQLMKASDERRARYREELKKLSPDQKPPDDYVSKGACPFECCRYGNWSVLEDTELVAEPGSRRVVGKAAKGTRVVGLTGEVHLKPEPVVVLKDGELPKDSIAFVLDNLGEGYARVYTRGKIVEVFVGVADYCLRVSDGCWGEQLLPPNERKEPVWWVKVRLPNGVIGWTDKPDRFGDKDACG